MKKVFTGTLIFIVSLFSFFSYAQPQPLQSTRHKVALFVPLYLDSAFEGSYYRYDKAFPKFLNPGLEFYLGAQAALDSLNEVGAPLEVFVFDSRSRRTPLAQQLNSPQMNGMQMIIGHATSPDVRILSEYANNKKIPFISTTLPNDAGITENPYYLILNSTLRTHCEGIYRYLQKYHSLDKIIVFRKPGVQENQVKEYLEEFANTTSSVPLRIQFEDIGSGFTADRLLRAMDTTRGNVVISGSLDEAFGTRLLTQLATIKAGFSLTVFGMPTWDGFNLTRPEYKSFEIIYSTPFSYDQPSLLFTNITNEFFEKVNGRPTDMYYRGYEAMLRFGLLLLETGVDVASNLTKKGNYVFTQFDIQPVFLDKQNMTLDYFENKKLYYIRMINGVKTVQHY